MVQVLNGDRFVVLWMRTRRTRTEKDGPGISKRCEVQRTLGSRSLKPSFGHVIDPTLVPTISLFKESVKLAETTDGPAAHFA